MSTTFLTRPLPQLSDRAAAGQSSAIRDLLEQAKRPGMISLAGGLPDASMFPAAELAAIAARVIAEDGARVLQYGTTPGDERARHALSSLFDPSTTADQIVVTTGSQQALDLITRVMINPGDSVVVGDPDYLGALQVFQSHGASLAPIAIDHHGLDTVQLEQQLRAGLRPKMCYVVPHFHNPTGATMSAERRAHLNALAQQFGFLVIEDDPYRELYFGGRTPRSMFGDPELSVSLRSTSKTLAPGLRVGALAGPTWLTNAIVVAKQSSDLHTSTLTQAIVAEALTAPWIDAHYDRLRVLYAAKRDALIRALDDQFGDTVSFAAPSGGMFLWLQMAEINDTSAWLAACLDNGVCFVPGNAFGVAQDLSQCLRLSFATPNVADLRVAVERMAAS